MSTLALSFSSNHAPVLPVLDSAPSDSDFDEAPPVGTLVLVDDGVDPVNLYARQGEDAWENLTGNTAA